MGSVIGVSRGSHLHNIDELLPTLKTGDIVLFQYEGLTCTLIQLFTRCPWSHIGMVIRTPALANNQPLIWESTYHSYNYNVLFRAKKNGVGLSLLEPHLRKFKGYCCAIRPLQYPPHMETILLQKALQSVQKYNGGSYDNSLIDLYICIQGSVMGDSAAKRHDSSFFCSHLIAQTFIDMGVLPSDSKPAMEYIPMDFSIEGDTCFNPGFGFECTLFIDTGEDTADEDDGDDDDSSSSNTINLRRYQVTLRKRSPSLLPSSGRFGNDPT